MYHAVTRDWIANEIFRRVEPQKRTMGEYLSQELPDIDIHIGLHDQEAQDRVVDLKNMSGFVRDLYTSSSSRIGFNSAFDYIRVAKRII